jgi:hypothetical protein
MRSKVTSTRARLPPREDQDPRICQSDRQYSGAINQTPPEEQPAPVAASLRGFTFLWRVSAGAGSRTEADAGAGVGANAAARNGLMRGKWLATLS